MGATNTGPDAEQASIERWWPKLSIGAKHRLLEALDEPLDAQTAEEIASITGRAAPERLSNSDQAFVRTQIEPVD
ncbi:hypothetical protein [Microbacterium sp.]|uniref:hypothetical protein n=1 Tax=Microbacterium sp. TaxID=51671 RepID=UPI0028124717|nr:hypothetical protein [Microbacterium sp.]